VLTFLLVAVTLLFLPTVLLCVLHPRPAVVLWTRLHRPRTAAAAAEAHAGAPTTDLPQDPAVRAFLEGPPSAGDSCDRCAVQAAAAVYLPGGRLLLCGHHGRQYQAALQAQGALVVGDLSLRARSTVPAQPTR
jgi:hypothetical protein